ncbi:unnamed protein product [Cylindrotheca closterium]|uniref:SCP domain-containing protein n=1 Tax=Cylindrotheca closterium TaxID=2856 RepID=A0AAD2PWH2_9STRA|nr:unnamed protein product [Cylindrotheca closterium]
MRFASLLSLLGLLIAAVYAVADETTTLFDSLPDFNRTDLLSRVDDPVIVFLSNEASLSDIGVSAQAELVLDLVSRIHFTGDGPQYVKVAIPDKAKDTVAVVQELYNRGIRTFVGPETSAQAFALGQWAESEVDPKEDVVFFSFWASNPGLAEYSSIIQLIPSDVDLVSAFLALRLDVPGRKFISVIHDDGIYAKGIADLFMKNAHHLMAAMCELPTNQVEASQARSCTDSIVQASAPEETMVVLITSGQDTRVVLQAAFDVYTSLGYSGNSNGAVMWVGGDSIAFDASAFDDADVETDIWRGAQLVNLNAVVAGPGPLASDNDLTIKFWNDFATFLGSMEGDDVVASSDVSPIVLIAADVASLIFVMSSQGAIHGGGCDREDLRIAILRLSPFLFAHTGPLRLSTAMQRRQMPFVVAGVVKQDSRPPLKDGIWQSKSIITLSQTGVSFEISSAPMAAIIPSRNMLKTQSISNRQRRYLSASSILITDKEQKDLFKGDVVLMVKNDNMFNAFDGAKGTTLGQLSPDIKPMSFAASFPRRLEEGKFSQILVRSVIGDSRLAFQPSGWASDKCLRQIERTMTFSEMAEEPGLSSSLCGTSQTGFVLSLIGLTSVPLTGAEVSDFVDCDQRRLLAAGREAGNAAASFQTFVSKNGDDNARNLTCVESQVLYSHQVGHLAMWGDQVCAIGSGHASLGEAYEGVHESLFVSSGPAKPMLDLPGLIQSIVQQGNDSVDLMDERFSSHIRGEDWTCGCDSAGTHVTCTQMYTLMECPLSSSDEDGGRLDLERDCCIRQAESVSCEESDPFTCTNAIIKYMEDRDEQLAKHKSQIAIHPKAVMEGYRLPLVLQTNTTSDAGAPFIADFQLGECFRYDQFERDSEMKFQGQGDPSNLRFKTTATRTSHHHESRSDEHVEARSCQDYVGKEKGIWVDVTYGDNCTWYEVEPDACEYYSDDEGTDGLTAGQACCECGGGSTSNFGATDPPVAPATVVPGSAGSDATEWVQAHNTRRKKYANMWGLEYKPVGWNEDLAAQAQAWADHLITKDCGSIYHATDDCLVAGENIRIKKSSPDPPEKDIDAVLYSWTEKEIENTARPDKAGHAAQVLWKGSTAIGCAIATGYCSDIDWEASVQVCRYFPQGNYNCGGHCIDSVKNNTMEVRKNDAIQSTSALHECLKKEVDNYA